VVCIASSSAVSTESNTVSTAPYLEIVRPRRLTTTFIYEGFPDHQAVDSLSFDAVGDGTTVCCRNEHASIETRDTHLRAGMEEGLADTLDRLEEWSLIAGSSSRG
jgi:uncharacterized protein YndB with AHSA1/START domain